jgi:hypothetical protein
MADRKTIYLRTKQQLTGFKRGLNYAYIDGGVKKTSRGFKVQAVKR